MAFDIDTYKQMVQPVDVSDIDFAAFRTRPLDPSALRCLRYMHDVEQHTVCYLRDLLVTRAHRDAAMTTFLTFWNFEEYWHGEVIGRVLAEHGEAAGAERVQPMRTRLGWRDHLAPLASMAASAAARDFTAIHMTWGAVNEWTTQAGYARLATRAKHPVLDDLLRRIMRQEGRHIDFYATEARSRLTRSAAARRLTRLALKKLWGPVGSSVMPKEEVAFVATYLLGGEEGRPFVDRIDRRIHALPGLDGLGVVARAVDRVTLANAA